MESIWRDELPQKLNPWSFLLFSTQPYKKVAWWSLLLVVVGSLAGAATAYIFKLIVDASQAAVTGGELYGLWFSAAAYIVISLIDNLAWRGSGFTGMRWATGIRATARYALTSHVSQHSHTYFANRFAGSISSKITQAANSTKDIAEQILWNFLPFVITMTASFFLAFSVSPYIAFIFLAWICIITPVNAYLVKWGVPLSVAAQKTETVLVGATVDAFTNVNAVQEYARRSFELTRIKGLIVDRRETGMRNWRFREFLRLGNGILQIFFIGGMILTATYLTTKGILTPGDIVLIVTIILIVQGQLTFIGNQLNNFGDAWGQVVESLNDLAQPHDINDNAKAKALKKVKGGITIKNIDFSYAGVSVFNNLDFTIPAGQKVGLVGRSGAGKSTLIKLLLRHHVADAGSILIDETNVDAITRESLREHIAIVPQEPMLFHRTIRENIAYGKPSATEAEVIKAAKLAQAHDFIMALPDGYESLVGERGVKLSGGQRQRVVIARAFLKDAPILLLDEATSSLDSESEGAVQKALLSIMEGRTVIAIAHRLSTLRAMDRIIVMDAGRIIEDGTHDELLSTGGLYADLWNHQAGGFLVD